MENEEIKKNLINFLMAHKEERFKNKKEGILNNIRMIIGADKDNRFIADTWHDCLKEYEEGAKDLDKTAECLLEWKEENIRTAQRKHLK